MRQVADQDQGPAARVHPVRVRNDREAFVEGQCPARGGQQRVAELNDVGPVGEHPWLYAGAQETIDEISLQAESFDYLLCIRPLPRRT